MATRLREAILSGEYEPGARIRQEDLADRHGASRVPVREALRMLEAEGLVTLVANTGAWVARLSQAECDELYQVRERIEPLLLRYNVPLLVETDIDRLDALAVAMEKVGRRRGLPAARPRVPPLELRGRDHVDAGGPRAHALEPHHSTTAAPTRGCSGRRATAACTTSTTCSSPALHRRDADEGERVLAGHIRRTRLELDRHPEVFDV